MFFKKKKKEEKRDIKEFNVDEEGFPIVSYKHAQRLKEKALLVNYPIGSDVICKSNNEKTYRRGKIISYFPFTQANQLTPMVRFTEDEEPFLVMGIVRHYSKELCVALDKLSGVEQWNVLAEFHKMF